MQVKEEVEEQEQGVEELEQRLGDEEIFEQELGVVKEEEVWEQEQGLGVEEVVVRMKARDPVSVDVREKQKEKMQQALQCEHMRLVEGRREERRVGSMVYAIPGRQER